MVQLIRVRLAKPFGFHGNALDLSSDWAEGLSSHKPRGGKFGCRLPAPNIPSKREDLSMALPNWIEFEIFSLCDAREKTIG